MPPADVPIAITSWHAQTPFGDLANTLTQLEQGRCIDDHARATPPGERHRASMLAFAVARKVAGGRLSPDAAVIVGTSKGNIEDWFHPPTSDNPFEGLNPAGLGVIASELSKHFGTHGPVLTLSAACASGLHALIRGAMMIRAGEVRQALIVAVEASVHPLFLGSFERLGILAKPGAGCRPFDVNRKGFYMSEAGAGVLMEAVYEDSAVTPVYVEHFALGGDATHLTGNDADGRVLRHLLGRVIDPSRPVDLIHAHGTGTEMNDVMELAAIEACLPGTWDRPPVLYSHKAALGHSLGASGLLSVVINCACHADGRIPPNIRTTSPLSATRVVIPRAVTSRAVHRSLTIAAGFGGPTAVVSLTSA